MPVPATNDEFLDLVRKSGVIDNAKLNAYLDRVKAGTTPVPEQPTKFAGWLVRDGILTYFQAEQILSGKYKRFTIGKYKVLEKLGAGGMGQVFLCEHKTMRRRVAVKVLPMAMSNDTAARERFIREARAVAALDHPNIVRAYDVDEEDNLHYLVMEFVDGTNLHDLVKKHGVLAVDRACHYIYAAAAGLQYASGMGIVHRDIKPGNLLVDRAGIVKILDMGLAMFSKDEDESLTRKHDENVLGTADYLAPEQAIDSHQVDIRADIYSLGGTFYYLLVGTPPFPDGSIAQKLLAHQTQNPKPISLIRPEVPEGVIAIVETMMKKDPKERYTTPADLMAALSPWVQTPIAPPGVAEMPKLSRAAQGGATQSSAVGRAPPSGVLMASNSTGIAIIPSSSSSTNSAIMDGPGVWANIASETVSARGSDTKPDKTKDSGRMPPPADEPRNPNRKALLFGSVAALLALAVAAIFIFGKKSTPVANTSATPAGPRMLYVTKGTGTAETTFTTLAAALKKVNPGDTIQLIDDVHEEAPIDISGKLKDVTIEAGNPSKSVKLKLPAGSAASPSRGMIRLNAPVGLKLRNLHFDAAGKVDHCIVIVGQSDGLVLEYLSLRGATTSDIQVSGAFAAPENPARFERLVFNCDSSNADAIQVKADLTNTVSNFVIQNCRFAGPGWGALHLRGVCRSIDFRNNRIYNFELGVHVDVERPENHYQLKIENNTFHTVKKALFMAGKPAANPPTEIVLQQNYFAICPDAMRGVDSRILKLIAKNNVRDRDTKGPPELNAVELPTPAIAIPPGEDDANFLKIDERSPLRNFGPEKLRIGAQ